MKTNYSLIEKLPFVFVWHDGIARVGKWYYEKNNTVICNDIEISMESITEDMIISGKETPMNHFNHPSPLTPYVIRALISFAILIGTMVGMYQLIKHLI